jgi:long-chain acyl-CoA synthetase
MGKFMGTQDYCSTLFAGQEITKGEIASAVEELALHLVRRVKSRSPFVFLLAPNHLKTVISYYAIIRADMIAVMIDPKIGPLEFQEAKDTTPPAAVISPDPEAVEFDYEREIVFPNGDDRQDLHGALADVCTVIYSAASDGYAKAVLLTRRAICADSQAMAAIIMEQISKPMVTCALLPFYTMFGLHCAVLTPMWTDPPPSVLVEGFGDLGQLVACANRIAMHKVTHLSTIPSVYHLLTMAPEVTDQLQYVEYMTTGACKLPPPVFTAFLEKFGQPIREGYGLTEAAPLCTYSHAFRPESVGRAVQCCEVRVVDGHDGLLPADTVGEICVRGRNVMKGYYNNDRATQETLRNGWLHTGDLGRMDSDGYVYITGLKKRMLNVAGRKIYPAEVERLMRRHENVETVDVYRRPSKLCGDGIRATVRLKKHTAETEGEFCRWCFENISHYKVPKRIEFL